MFCPNCGKGLPDGADFCPNCGTRVSGTHMMLDGTAAVVGADAGVLASASPVRKRKLSSGWITLISIICVLAVAATVVLPIYFRAPLLPVASATSDGETSYSYEFNKKNGILTIQGKDSGSYKQDGYLKMSPYATDQWLIALSATDSTYNLESLQICLAGTDYMFVNINEYVLANNKYVAEGKIKEIDVTTRFASEDGSEDVDTTRYLFVSNNNRVDKITELSKDYDGENVSETYSISYDEKERIVKIVDEDGAGDIFRYKDDHFLQNEDAESPDDNTPDYLPPFSSEIQNGHMTAFNSNYGALSSSYTTYKFSGSLPSTVDIITNSADAMGSSKMSDISKIYYKNKRVTQIDTNRKYDSSYIEDVTSGKVTKEHKRNNVRLMFQYKRIL